MSLAFFFPGQGSQSLGMMNGFAEQAIVKATFDEASAVLGQDLWAMINGEDAELIGQTVNTQPIMLAAGIATYRAYLEAGGKILQSLQATVSANTPPSSLPAHWISQTRSNWFVCAPNLCNLPYRKA